MIAFRYGLVIALLWSPITMATDHIVVIKDYQFQPAQLNVKVGDRVIWRNDEKRANHSILFSYPGAVESERLFNQETHTLIFSDAGEFPYHCGPHPEMTGKIRVDP